MHGGINPQGWSLQGNIRLRIQAVIRLLQMKTAVLVSSQSRQHSYVFVSFPLLAGMFHLSVVVTYGFAGQPVVFLLELVVSLYLPSEFSSLKCWFVVRILQTNTK